MTQKMSFSVFLKVVEIQTKLASLFPFIIGVLFSIAYFQEFNPLNTGLFFIGMLIFDMATTAINNYMDYKKAKSEAYKYEENIIGQSKISPVLVRNLIFLMIGFAAIVGVILSLRTDFLFFCMGGVCCFIGIFYTFGPIPLSRMPLGELFSGLTMGLGIFVMTIYLNVHTNPPFGLVIDFKNGLFALTGNFWMIVAIVLASLPIVFTIANIMLANNLRDLDTDIENHRYTLVYYIGRPQGTKLFSFLMLSCYGVIAICWIARIYSWPILLTFLSLPPILSNLKQFKQELPEPKSFRFSIKNLIMFNGSYILGILGTILLNSI